MKRSFSADKTLVAVLFVTVIVLFSFAQEDTREVEKKFLDPATGLTEQTGKFFQPVQPVRSITASLPLR